MQPGFLQTFAQLASLISRCNVKLLDTIGTLLELETWKWFEKVPGDYFCT